MPHYDYLCESCNHNFEIFQSIKEDALKLCPRCQKPIKRLITGGAGIIFKGSGWTPKGNSDLTYTPPAPL